MRYAAQLAVFGFLFITATAAQGQDPASAKLNLEPATPSVDLCRAALESGRILRSDETGAYILADYHLVRLTIDGDQITCTAQFVVNP